MILNLPSRRLCNKWMQQTISICSTQMNSCFRRQASKATLSMTADAQPFPAALAGHDADGNEILL